MILLSLSSLLLIPGVSVPRASASGAVASVQSSAITSPLGRNGFSGPSGQIVFDVDVGVNLNYVMHVTQDSAAVYYRSSGLLSTFYLDRIFGFAVGDTRVIYDSSSSSWNGHWYVIGIVGGAACPPCPINLAVSPYGDPDAPQPWTTYQLSTSNFPDHPEIALTADRIILTANSLSGSGYQYWIINKNDMTHPITGYISRPSTCNTQPYPVRSVNSGSRMYLLCGVANNHSSNDIRILYVDSTSSTPTIANVVPSSFTEDGSVATPGGTITLFATISATAYMNTLWFGVPTPCTPYLDSQRNCVRLTELDTTSLPAKVVAGNDFNFTQWGYDFFLPALSMDGTGNLDLVFGYSSSNLYPSLGIVGRLTSDSPGTLTLWQSIRSGSGNNPNNAFRYGDYFGAAPDPADANNVWVAGGYYPSSGGWATFMASARMLGLRMSASSSVTFAEGTAQKVPVTVSSLGGFSGTVLLGWSISCPGTTTPSVTISPMSVQLSISGTNVTTVTVDASNYYISNTCQLQVEGQTSFSNMNVVVLPITVRIGPSLICSATASPTQGSYSVTVQFTASCSAGTPPYSYSWSFNDGGGAASTSQNTQYTYYANGYGWWYYYPTLTVTDSFGISVNPALPRISVYGGAPCGFYAHRSPAASQNPQRICL